MRTLYLFSSEMFFFFSDFEFLFSLVIGSFLQESLYMRVLNEADPNDTSCILRHSHTFKFGMPSCLSPLLFPFRLFPLLSFSSYFLFVAYFLSFVWGQEPH